MAWRSAALSPASDWKPGIHFITFGELTTTNVCVTAKEDQLGTSHWVLKKYLRLTLCPDGDDRKMINNATVYGTPLSKNGSYTSFDHHELILLKIGNLFATLEKHTDGLTVQSSTERDDVLARVRGDARYGNPIKKMKSQGNIAVGDLIDYIVDNDFIHEAYNLIRGDHCQKFAKDIFDKVVNTA